MAERLKAQFFPFLNFTPAPAILIDELDARQISRAALYGFESFHESSPYLFREP